MTNPDNVGGLRDLLRETYNFLFGLGSVVHPSKHEYVTGLAKRIDKAAGELCRAAPAGGDDGAAEASADVERCDSCDGTGLLHRADGMYVGECHCVYSAPAGSGEVDEAEALREFTEYFVKNYPGPHTVIMDPNWHAPKIFRAAKRALLRMLQQGADYVMVPREPTSKMAALGAIAHKERGMAAAYRAMIAASQGQEGGANG